MFSLTIKKNVRPLLSPRAYYCLAALGIVLLLYVLPQTGWIVRRQLAGQGSKPHTAENANEYTEEELRKRLQDLQVGAAEHKNRFEVQLAWANEQHRLKYYVQFLELGEKELSGDADGQALEHIQAAGKIRRLTYIWELRNRFHTNPAANAGYLISTCTDNVSIGRNLERELMACKTTAEARQRLLQRERSSNSSQILSRWETDPVFVQRALEAAREGERLESTNGFFPTMQAAALLARKQDDKAIEALVRAASKPDWNSYQQAERDGQNLLYATVNGPLSAGQRYMPSWTWDGHYFGTLRSVADIAIVLAALRERRGDFAGGLRIRKAIARIGMHLRVVAPDYVANKYGIELVRLAAWRPGGAVPAVKVVKMNGGGGAPSGFSSVGPPALYVPPPPAPSADDLPEMSAEDYDASSERRNIEAQRQKYISYLNRHGEKAEASWYTQESATDKYVGKIIGNFNYGEFDARLYKLDILWLTGNVLITQTFCAILLGGIGARLSRASRVRGAAPLGRESRWAFAMLPLALVGGICGGALGDYLLQSSHHIELPLNYYLFVREYFKYVCGVGFGLLILALPLLILRKPPRGEWNRSQRKTRFRATIWRYTQTLGLTSILIVVVLLLYCFFVRGSIVSSYASSFYSVIPLDWFGGGFNPVAIIVYIIVLVVFPVRVAYVVVASLIRRVPVSVGLIRDAYHVAPRIAVCFLLAWTIIVGCTLYMEDKASGELVIAAQHEGRFQAASVGQVWPGATPEVSGKEERL